MRVDLRSDTVTRPTKAMRQAIASAEVGDDVLEGDPTTRRLEERVADMLGKEAGLFFPSGTMANQAAVWALSRPGTEIVLDAEAHIVRWEMAGAAALSGVQPHGVRGAGGVMDAQSLRDALLPRSPHQPAVSLVCLENTHNGAGGRVTPPGDMRAMQEAARDRDLPVHLDGARLWNAAASGAASLREFASCADTVMVSFSKGLGAPVGAALVGPRDAIRATHTIRKRLGGGMRQSGVLAAAALHALDHHLDRLIEDHEAARDFARAMDGLVGSRVVAPDTNIVMVDLPPGVSAVAVVEKAAAGGVFIGPWSATRIRAVTHLDAPAESVRAAAEVVAAAIEGLALRDQ